MEKENQFYVFHSLKRKKKKREREISLHRGRNAIQTNWLLAGHASVAIEP